MKEQDAWQLIGSTSDEELRRSARIVAKTQIINLDRNSNSSVERNEDTTVSTKTKRHQLSEIKSAVERHMHVYERKQEIDWEK